MSGAIAFAAKDVTPPPFPPAPDSEFGNAREMPAARIKKSKIILNLAKNHQVKDYAFPV